MTYPIELINNEYSALLLCCAGDIKNNTHIIGNNDVQYFSNLDNVTLVDLNPDTMNILKNSLYKHKQNWVFIVDDMYKVCNNFLITNKKFDIISCDPWTNQMEDLLFNNLNNILPITNKYLITGFSKILSDKYNLNLNMHSIETFINKRYNINISIINLIKRSGYLGGIYWIVMQKNN